MNPYLEVIFRSVAVYVFIVAAIRLFGKKELSQLSVIDLVFILLISNSVQNAMVGPDTGLLTGIAAAATLFIINALLKYTLYSSKLFSRLVQGEPVMLIHKGIVIKKNLHRQRLTHEELEAAVREHGVENIAKVDLAVLEVDGNISILSENYHKKTLRKRRSHKIVTKTT
ncbi:MAG: DUF421 domain-containing protein [Bacteroidia bacterium]|nr:DUF421 domain-containing protein [Bacteroidia bacterium]